MTAIQSKKESYPHLGNYHREITTHSPEAKIWFNRGLIWCYAFAFEEAKRCFERAIQFDQHCSMAYWGVAYAVGPYYNKQWVKFETTELSRTLDQAFSFSQQALKCKSSLSKVEQALINALSKRFQSFKPPKNFDTWNNEYADEMRKVFKQFPNDPDVCALFADAMMNRTPWALWDLKTGQPCKRADTLEALDVVENKLKEIEKSNEDIHPGLLHLHIHLLEMSPFPEKALNSADILRTLIPDAGHLCHMPTHIDVLCGDYINAVVSNDRAIAADQKLVEREGLVNFHALSRAHNFHLKLYAAMLLGNYKFAREASKGLVATIPEKLLRWESPPMADWLEGYVSMYIHPLIRFGRWNDILEEPFPEDKDLYCSTIALLRYARTLAFAVLGKIKEAELEIEKFIIAANKVPSTRTIFNNKVIDLLKIAKEMAEGELAYRKNAYDEAFDKLRHAVKLSDQLPYDEPWGWMQPARHALGALLLEQDYINEAETVYREDLGLDPKTSRAYRHLENVWSLHGYHECLQKLGKYSEAQLIAPKLAIAQARSDLPIAASCLCRLKRWEIN